MLTGARDPWRRDVSMCASRAGETAGQRPIATSTSDSCHGPGQTHNPEVTGSNPVLATTKVQVRGPFERRGLSSSRALVTEWSQESEQVSMEACAAAAAAGGVVLQTRGPKTSAARTPRRPRRCPGPWPAPAWRRPPTRSVSRGWGTPRCCAGVGGGRGARTFPPRLGRRTDERRRHAPVSSSPPGRRVGCAVGPARVGVAAGGTRRW